MTDFRSLTPQRFDTATLRASGVKVRAVWNGAARLHYLNVHNDGTTDLWLLIFDKSEAVEADDKPVDVLPLPADGGATFSYPGQGRQFDNGIAWAASSTARSYTAPASSDCAGVAGFTPGKC